MYTSQPGEQTAIIPGSFCLYGFGPYEVDSRRHELRKFGRRVRLEPKPFRLLLFLLQHSGELVPRETLRNALWGDGVFVDFEHGLNVAVKKLRAALCDSADEPQFIETVPGEGYRFSAHVEQIVSPTWAPEANLQNPKQPETGFIAAGTVPEGRGGRAEVNPQKFWRRATGWLAPAAMVCLAAGLVAVAPHAWVTPSHSASASRSKIMLVVLPFENLSGDPAQEYFSDGMTEELSEQLGNLDPQRLGVIGRTSAMAYKQSPRNIRQIGSDLGVDYVLEGSVRRDGSTLRVTAQLVQVPDQSHV